MWCTIWHFGVAVATVIVAIHHFDVAFTKLNEMRDAALQSSTSRTDDSDKMGP
jgi:hypothetical protein